MIGPTSKHPGFVAILAASLVLAGCGNDVGVILQLVSDSSEYTEAQLMEEVADIEILLDAEGGFNGINRELPQVEGFQIVDPDQDGEYELLLSLDVSDRMSLPAVRLDPGRNIEKSIEVRVRCIDSSGQVSASGSLARNVLFQTGEITEREVPVRLVRSRLAPAVLAVSPNSLPSGADLGSIAFYTSSPLDPDTLSGNVTVRFDHSGPGDEIDVPGTVEGPRTCPFGTEMWTFVPSACHEYQWILSVTLVIGPMVSDPKGRPIHDGAGNPGFVFTLTASQMRNLGPCTARLPCDELGFGDPGRSDLVCDTLSGMFEPAPCTVSPSGCLGDKPAFDWLQASEVADCLAVREDSLLYLDSCVISEPWPCSVNSACSIVGDGCNDAIQQCYPLSCTDSCADDATICVLEQGCLPRIGGCKEDCEISGACPEFEQTCTLVESGAHVCR